MKGSEEGEKINYVSNGKSTRRRSILEYDSVINKDAIHDMMLPYGDFVSVTGVEMGRRHKSWEHGRRS